MILQSTTTIAILRGDSVTAGTLKVLLTGVGYEVRLVGEGSASDLGESLEGVGLLILPPGTDPGPRKVLLAAADETPAADRPAVVELSSLESEGPRWDRSGRGIAVPWPCGITELVRYLELALREKEPDEKEPAAARHDLRSGAGPGSYEHRARLAEETEKEVANVE